jgi:hypothetical protein
MDQEELDSLLRSRPFTSADASRAERDVCRLTPLGIALWGATSADLQRQLLAAHPEVPSGVDLDELRNLEQSVQNSSLA